MEGVGGVSTSACANGLGDDGDADGDGADCVFCRIIRGLAPAYKVRCATAPFLVSVDWLARCQYGTPRVLLRTSIHRVDMCGQCLFGHPSFSSSKVGFWMDNSINLWFSVAEKLTNKELKSHVGSFVVVIQPEAEPETSIFSS